MIRIQRVLAELLIGLRSKAAALRDEEGQTVAEYALVLLVAAAVAGGFLVWAKSSGRLDGFFDAVFNNLLGSVTSSPSPSPAP